LDPETSRVTMVLSVCFVESLSSFYARCVSVQSTSCLCVCEGKVPSHMFFGGGSYPKFSLDSFVVIAPPPQSITYTAGGGQGVILFV